MGFRFRRSIRLAPGLRLNVGKRGVGLSAGARGASMSFGRHGTYTNFGIPGTGLSFRQRVGNSSSQARRLRQGNPNTIKLSTNIHLDDEGNVEFQDSSGNPLPDTLVRQAKRQQGDSIRQWLSEECEKINQQVRALETIHLNTPNPNVKPVYHPRPYDVRKPAAPTLKSLGILGRLFKSVHTRIDTQNAQTLANYKQKLDEWRTGQIDHIKHESEQKQLLEERIYSDHDAMSRVFEDRLQAITWPRETNVSFEIVGSGQKVSMDVDLPEIEDMPSKTASLPARGWKVSMKTLTDTKQRQLYMTHIHGIGFRLIGEAFSTLPTVTGVTLSAYSQRPSKTTGNVEDEYLYSVHVDREAWSRINFGNLRVLDMAEALAQFDLRRDMTKTGIFKPIEPYDHRDKSSHIHQIVSHRYQSIVTGDRITVSCLLETRSLVSIYVITRILPNCVKLFTFCSRVAYTTLDRLTLSEQKCIQLNDQP